MFRRVRRALALALVGLVGVLTALALTAAILLSRELSPTSLSLRLTKLLEQKTTVESAELGLFPFPHVIAEGVTVGEILSARRVKVRPSLRALVRGRLEIAEVRIETATLELTREPDGNFALDIASLHSDPDDAEARIPNIEIADGRLLLRDAETAETLEEIQIERLRLARDWLASDFDLDLRASLGPDGMTGLLHAKGTLGPHTLLEVTLRGVQANRILPHIPASWDIRSASGVVDGKVHVERDESELQADLDLTLRGGGANLAGVRIAGESRIAGRVTLGTEGFTLTESTFSAEAIQVYDYSATGLSAEFDWAGDELELRGLELGTVSAGITAAAALGLPGSEAVPLVLRVEKAGKLSLRGSLSFPSAEEPSRQLSVPNLTAIGTELALVYNPGPDESITRLRVNSLRVRGYAADETATAELDAQILGADVSRITASASLGPLTAERALLENPLHLEISIDSAPPEVMLPYIPASWVVPKTLGPVDLTVDIAGTAGRDLAGDVTVRSRFGSPPGPVGTLVANIRTEPVTDPDDSPITVELTIEALDLVLLEPLPTSWRVDTADGLLNAAVVLHATPTGEFEGDFESHVEGCSVVLGDVVLGGTCRANGHVVRTGRGLTLPAFDLAADTARFREVEGTRFRMRGLLLPPALQVESASLNVWGGSVEIGGAVLFERPPRYELETTATHLNFASVQGAPADSERARDPNRIDAHARVRGTWRDAESWLTPLEGTGELNFYEGAVVGMPLRRAIAEALLSVVPGASLVVGERPLPRTRLEHATVPFSFEEGKIRLEGMEVVTPDYRLRGYGQIEPDFSYRLEGDVRLTSDGLKNTLGLVSAPRVARRTLSLPAIPLTARGSFIDDEDADVRVDVTEITVNVARGLLGLPVAAGSAATGAVRRGLGALRPGGRDRRKEAIEESP